jgi:hypothetical protein
MSRFFFYLGCGWSPYKNINIMYDQWRIWIINLCTGSMLFVIMIISTLSGTAQLKSTEIYQSIELWQKIYKNHKRMHVYMHK